jgi:branched-chain amino acid transport system permease protein
VRDAAQATMRILTIIVMDGTIFAAILFLISVGLTLVYGVLRILNVSHGGIYALGAYMATFLALAVLGVASPYLTYLMLLAGAIIVGMVVGPVIERVFLRRIYASDVHIQLLLTFSIFLILDDLMKVIWGTKPLFVSEPYKLLGEFSVSGIPYSWYQVLLILASILFGGFLVWGVRGTHFGKIVVAVINDREISQAIGINVNRIYTWSFTLGALCAALGGALIAPTIAVVPGFAVDATVLAFAVIAIGGMGSLEGAALGALMVGLLRALAVHMLPEADLVVVYLAMILVLLVRPEGLFGEVQLRRI